MFELRRLWIEGELAFEVVILNDLVADRLEPGIDGDDLLVGVFDYVLALQLNLVQLDCLVVGGVEMFRCGLSAGDGAKCEKDCESFHIDLQYP